MASTTRTLTEPTAQQLKLTGGLVQRISAAHGALEAVEAAVAELKGQGAPGMSFFRIEVRDVYREMTLMTTAARILEATGGRWGFTEWLFYRVAQNSSIRETIEACEDDQNRAILAVEHQVRVADPELTIVLDRVAQNTYLHDDEEYARRAGMPRAEVESRARDVLAKIIESGWRP